MAVLTGTCRLAIHRLRAKAAWGRAAIATPARLVENKCCRDPFESAVVSDACFQSFLLSSSLAIPDTIEHDNTYDNNY